MICKMCFEEETEDNETICENCKLANKDDNEDLETEIEQMDN